MKADMAKRAERAKIQESKYREMPDIVVRVVCKYRAELYFKISRKTKLSRLFNAWTERMETNMNGAGGNAASASAAGASTVSAGNGKKGGSPQLNGTIRSDAASTSGSSSSLGGSSMQFIFSHGGRTLEPDQTPEEAGIEEGDVILAVEMMDLTEGPGTEELDEPQPVRQKLRKEWVENPTECVVVHLHKWSWFRTQGTTADTLSRARKTLQSIFDGVYVSNVYPHCDDRLTG